MKTTLSTVARSILVSWPMARWVACCMVVTVLLMQGCTHSDSGSGNVQAGKTPFHFDPKHVVALSLVKADPITGDHWSARVERIQDNQKSFFDGDPWQIKSFSSSELLDRSANRTWILHFIDTLTTYRPDVKLDLSSISPEVRSNYGLNPPHYEIQWQVMNQETQKLESFELQIGNSTTQKDTGHSVDEAGNGESYAIFPPSKDIYEANGASMAMLDFLKNFSGLRRETLSTLESDDVDEIKIEKSGTKVLYAQRDGDRWTDEKHHPVKGDVGALLDRITHLRVLQFIDDAEQAKKMKSSMTAKTVVTLTDRYSHSMQMDFAKVKDLTVATVSTRPDAVFDLFPGSLEKISVK